MACRISMSRRGNPYDNPAIGGDNAQAESFIKTLKSEACINFSGNLPGLRGAVQVALLGLYH